MIQGLEVELERVLANKDFNKVDSGDIIAREFKIPCIVNTKIGTKLFKL